MNRTTTTPDPTARRRAVVIALCWALVLLDGIDTFVYGSVLPEMIGSGQLGLTDATAGEIGSATTFGMLVGTVLSGTVTRWVGRRPAVFASVALFTAATLGSGLAGSAVAFGFCRLLCGFGLGALLPIAIAYGMEFWPGNRRALATGVIMTAHQAGGALAPLIALVLVDTAGWRWVFVAGAVPAVVLLPVAVRLLPESPAILAARGRSQEAAAVSAEHGLASAAPVPAPPAPGAPPPPRPGGGGGRGGGGGGGRGGGARGGWGPPPRPPPAPPPPPRPPPRRTAGRACGRCSAAGGGR
ncbi:MFS transporter [Saccharopolyspora sp. 6T]|uniref:MFS transporter n=1 Tax=Saccharopolyspora sp. 6T TaxID=2877238 RepID=UPI001CD2F981|nr:MFS transporter [Saccharopolyspora sp. 6T]MCA1187555.1 MFS transporter [Saccharopolyspora sp. 6T]